MGYTTTFSGNIHVSPPLNAAEVAYINKFSETRRMNRKNGPYFVDGTGDFGQGKDKDVIDYNSPDSSQPGLWCQWVSTKNGKKIKWNGGEKFYKSVAWMQYIIEHFLKEDALGKEELAFFKSHTLNGIIKAYGEDSEDRWTLAVKDNEVFEFPGHHGPVT